mmetsp:Transcript_35188/g.48828  ORF Transcript_35188/g.48828 Transcript_35188/m.48828 type:complete len:103 (-) Transcript_35188:184-492(-)|eukprot:CAMPEP_0196579278 /NCGR_PEP_ID=MMETSP1081-20130531/19830_1 /TAXON_ID=36882 /ORGANISM="Pyramimonas amylifera, Strain CCMP720" /LENGTH=102 /DNA_ID=CAMNT_0041898807 /DNA_START=188 /DNA_END=496 /DNA_ORIENTATION=+
MAYNLYQVQMAQAWKERVDKENAMAEKAQLESALARTGMDQAGGTGSVASYRTAGTRSTKKSYNTNVLRGRLDELEAALHEERALREKVEKDLSDLKQNRDR